MKDAIRMEVKGIKCDNPSCDFIDMSVKFEDYEEWLNKPCPKCGSNLLTDKDYFTVRVLQQITKGLNEIFPQIEDNEKDIYIKGEMNGTGKVKFKTNE